MDKKALKGIYNAYAKNYSKLIEKAGWWAPRVVATYLKPYLKNGDVVLDGGCGDGYSSLEIFDMCEVYGFDHADEMVRYAKDKGFKDVVVHDADDKFPYKDNTFDAAIGLGFFEFIRNVNFTLSEFKRVMKPGGHLLITVEELDSSLPNQSQKKEKVVAGVSKTRYSDKEMRRFFKKIGFEVLKDERIYGYFSKSLKGKYYYHYYLLTY
jgi:ubiquinone/menaquinone biosynthesis C-methylase UbiE